MSEGKKQYEISFLARNEGDKEEVINALKAADAQIVFDGRFSEIKLAYPIEKQTVAYFGFVDFEADAEKIAEIDHAMRFNEKILRSLIITPPPRKPIPRQERRPEEPASEKSDEGVIADQIVAETPSSTKDDEPEKEEVKAAPTEDKEEVSDELLDQKLDEILK